MRLSSCYMICESWSCFFFFFNDTATTEIYTLSLHDALPICPPNPSPPDPSPANRRSPHRSPSRDRKSTRLNSSHSQISYAVFCLKKKITRTYRGRRLQHPSDRQARANTTPQQDCVTCRSLPS